jgi:hypothetical protein
MAEIQLKVKESELKHSVVLLRLPLCNFNSFPGEPGKPRCALDMLL